VPKSVDFDVKIRRRSVIRSSPPFDVRGETLRFPCRICSAAASLLPHMAHVARQGTAWPPARQRLQASFPTHQLHRNVIRGRPSLARPSLIPNPRMFGGGQKPAGRAAPFFVWNPASDFPGREKPRCLSFLSPIVLDGDGSRPDHRSNGLGSTTPIAPRPSFRPDPRYLPAFC